MDILPNKADKFIYDALFITITNANFDKVAITEKIKEGLKLKNELANKVKIENAPDECLWNGSEDEFEEKSKLSVCFALPTRISAH